jgi:hypothetical protein
MSEISTGETPRTDFEKEFGLIPLGDDQVSRIARAETLLAGYLRASANQHPSIVGNFTTNYGGETLPVPRPDTVESLLDGFRDPTEVQARDQWRLYNPDRND